MGQIAGLERAWPDEGRRNDQMIDRPQSREEVTDGGFGAEVEGSASGGHHFRSRLGEEAGDRGADAGRPADHRDLLAFKSFADQ